VEVFAGKDAEKIQKRKLISELLSQFKKINPDNEIFRIAGEFRRKYGVSIPDCIIAATAYSIDADLFTRNINDFKRIREIRVFEE